MGKVTSKLQITVPKDIADQFGIRPGDSLQWLVAGDVIRLVPSRAQEAPSALSPEQRLEIFDRSTARQRRREAALRRGNAVSSRSVDRGWKREDLYGRGQAD